MQQPLESADDVLVKIKQIYMENGEHLSKKEVKKAHPDILRNALYYFPSWEHALQNATDSIH